MTRMSDCKILAETLMMSLVIEGECQCEGPLDTCFYCTPVQGQEALERLVASDPFVEAPEREVGELNEASAIE